MYDFNTYPDTSERTSRPVIDNKLDLFVHEIDLLLDTEKYSVLGKRRYGDSIQQMLWKTNLTASSIQKELRASIEKYCTHAQYFSFTINVSFVKGSRADIGVIDMYIKDNGKVVQNLAYQYA